jgi:CubicO group peptidase (beta-lactamase class C family)
MIKYHSFRLKRILIFGFLLSTTSCVTSNNILKEKIDEIIDEYCSKDMFSGTVLIAKNNEPIYIKSFGFANENQEIKNQNSTRYNVGSIGKMFTAVLILKEIELGKLKINDTLKNLLPEYDFPNEDKITIKDLLSHTSGLSNYLSPVFDKERKTVKSIDDVIPYILKTPDVFNKPYGTYNYSNSGYIILGKILEKIYNKDFATILHNELFNPLGMKETGGYCLNKNNAMGYSINSLNEKRVDGAEQYCALFSDGGAYSMVEDILKFDILYIRKR